MKINELEVQSDYILLIGGKAVSKYKDPFEANQMRQHLLAKHPDKDIQIKKEVCKMTDVYEDSELLDKPTPSAAEIIKKHGMSEQDFLDQLRKGVKSELEHTSNVKVAIEIAMDHLNEYPDYYDRLERIETNEGTDSTQAAKPKGKIAKIHPNFDGPIPSLSTVPELAGAYYGMYRFGVHMAGSPTNAPHEHGPTANHMVTAAYTDAEADIINHSAKSMNMKVKAVTSKGSKEAPGTNIKSTVATPKKNKYGI